ncbi:MAG: hypothetical protein CMM40_08570 [Rhodospirillaceae bacterium]|nr:hypothetical protein [Rhodospirillaceae bacterium]
MKSIDSRKSIRFGIVRKIAVIGGSRLMVQTAEMMRGYGVDVVFVVAPRYAAIGFGPKGETLSEVAQALGADLICIEDIRKDGQAIATCGADMALCFGPAWVFPDEVIAGFPKGMYNYNAIPQPYYVGGAHHSWQAMNADFRGGCVVQAIGPEVDRGPILKSEFYSFPETVATPIEYSQVKDTHSLTFIKKFLLELFSDAAFEPEHYDTWNAKRLYFPRIIGKIHGWIDWRWSADHIVRFANAFGAPYDGARTYVNGRVVRLAQVSLLPVDDNLTLHPFCAGLVVRSEAKRVIVATLTGCIAVGSVASDEPHQDALEGVRDGTRFYTPSEVLDRAMRSSVQVLPNGNLQIRDPEK